MSIVVKQALVMAAGGVVIMMSVLRLARSRLLSARYAVGWIGVGVLVSFAAALMPFVGRLGQFAEITPTAVLLMMSSMVLLAITVQLSISVSGLQAQVRSLTEAHALLQHDVREPRPHA